MSILSDFPGHARAATVMLLAMLCVGCVRPLAVQHEFYSPTSGTADRIGVRTQHALSHHRALQVARHACGPRAVATAPPEARSLTPGPSAEFATSHEALAELCASRQRPSVAAHGGASNAYQRWVEDQVRDLPAASETAASAAGGS